MIRRSFVLLAVLATLAAMGAALLVRGAAGDRAAEAPPLAGSAPRPAETAKPTLLAAPSPASRLPDGRMPDAKLPDAKLPDTKPHDTQLAAAPDPAAATGVSYAVEPPFAIVDGRTFATENGAPTRLAGLDGPDAEAVCLDESGRLWACGLQARAALNNLIRKQSVGCRTVAPAEGGVLVANCRVAAGDLAGELVRAGFARPAPGLPASYAGAESEARREGRGLWRGGWTLRP